MKNTILKNLLPGILLAVSTTAIHAQQYSIGWSKVAGGGGSSTNAQFTLSGTIGQPEAGNTLLAGSYSLTGGFWSLIAVQTPGAPLLTIVRSGPNTVVVSWPAPSSGFVLQQSPALGTMIWTDVTTTPVVVGTQNQVAISPLSGNQFYRLKKQ